ncbi:CoA pyrophosphatase [Psychromonas sp. B3M02]|uniref:CoA pyrophosphatase n=1 Tax=Psychromonas sp. B3M02 TaxID=2267226 RepID=UPI000DE94E94|nr:CoA pyrophosphatase [Psychromonas sp. B3M02]RBW43198.1 CoA pyrophosphatase [Psychromonas sp. B3M02]
MNRQQFLNRFMLQQATLTSASSHLAQLQHHPRPLKKAAVLMPLVQRSNGLHMILTQRALHLRHHPGQVSFPGGRFETTDLSLATTALRETQEEIGIDQDNIQLVGRLPELTTSSGYHVTPFVGFVARHEQVIIDKSEVKSCFEVPFNYLLNNDNFVKQHLVANHKRHFTYCCAYQNHLIWGATAQMIINLQQHLQG